MGAGRLGDMSDEMMQAAAIEMPAEIGFAPDATMEEALAALMEQIMAVYSVSDDEGPSMSRGGGLWVVLGVTIPAWPSSSDPLDSESEPNDDWLSLSDSEPTSLSISSSLPRPSLPLPRRLIARVFFACD